MKPDNEIAQTWWAKQKLARARHHAEQLRRSQESWLSPVAHPLDLQVTADGFEVELSLTLKAVPPTAEWSLILGDCIHNVRTALDVFVWENSTLQSPDERRKAAYPILPRIRNGLDDDEPFPHKLESQSVENRRWISRQVAGLPEPLRSRVIGNVRWAVGVDEQGSLYVHDRLSLVRDLDDADKHRLTLDVSADWAELSHSVHAYGADGQVVPLNFGNVQTTRLPLEAGRRAVFVIGKADSPVATAVGDGHVKVEARVNLPDLSLTIPYWLEIFIRDVEDLLDFLASSRSLTP